MTADLAKVNAAAKALDFVKDGMLLGLGTGSTSAHFVRLLGERVRQGLRVKGVPTSEATRNLAEQVGVPLLEISQVDQLDLDIDGADELDPQFRLIKGGGGALLREKIVAAASKQLIILVGREKQVAKLGSRGKLPIEVVPFAVPVVLTQLKRLGIRGDLAMIDGRPLVTDNGNQIIDCAIPPLDDPAAFELQLRAIPGVIATGLFLQTADIVLVGDTETFILGEEHCRPTHHDLGVTA